MRFVLVLLSLSLSCKASSSPSLCQEIFSIKPAGSRLTNRERKAVKDYTIHTDDPMNRFLRSNSQAEKDSIREEFKGNSDLPIETEIELVRSGLSKLKAKPGVVYRGRLMSEREFANLATPGARYSDRAFMSTSEELNIASRFIGGSGDGLVRVILKIDGRSGRSLNRLNGKDEMEVLFPPEIKFEVTGVSQVRTVVGHHGETASDVFVLEMREID